MTRIKAIRVGVGFKSNHKWGYHLPLPTSELTRYFQMQVELTYLVNKRESQALLLPLVMGKLF